MARSRTRAIVRYVPRRRPASRTIIVRSRRPNSWRRKKLSFAILMGLTPPLVAFYDAFQANPDRDFFFRLRWGFYAWLASYTGWNQATYQWTPDLMKRGVYPLAAGWAVHWAANKFKINRYLARVPVIEI